MVRVLAGLLIAVLVSSAVDARAHLGTDAETPTDVTVCELHGDPGQFNHKLVRVTGFVSHGFENFSLEDPTCGDVLGVWVEYGGEVASGTVYCCGQTTARSRREPLQVEDVSVSLLEDTTFREFDRLIQSAPEVVVHATLVGRFFSGKRMEGPGGDMWMGYGHMGCCSLFVVERVESFDANSRSDLDYGSAGDEPGIENFSSYRILMPLSPYEAGIEAQRKADANERAWSFDDPRRVAVDALASLTGRAASAIGKLKVHRRRQGRFVYKWRPKGSAGTYYVVVSRPSWLAYYADDPHRVAWIVVAAYEYEN